MKRLKIIILILISFFTFNNIDAQISEKSGIPVFKVLGIFSVPQGEFSKINTEKSGFATLGFGAAAECDFSIAENWWWTSTISVIVNGMDESAFDNYMQNFGMDLQSAGSYTNYWLLSGISVGTEIYPNTILYMVLQAGLLISNFPDFSVRFGNLTINQTTSTANAFGYCVGIGTKIKHIDVVMKFYGGEPEYEQVATAGNIQSKVKIKLPISAIQIMAGIRI